MKNVKLSQVYWLNDEKTNLIIPFVFNENKTELISLYNGEVVNVKNEYNDLLIDGKNALINFYKSSVRFSQYVNFDNTTQFYLKHQYIMPLYLKLVLPENINEKAKEITNKFTQKHTATESYLKAVCKKYRAQNYKHNYELTRGF